MMTSRMLLLGLTVGTCSLFAAGTLTAEEPVLRLPFISINKGTPLEGLYVRFPVVKDQSRKMAGQQPGDQPPPPPVEPPPVMPQQPGELVPPPASGPLLPPPSGPVVYQAFSHRDFAKMFKPVEGTHQVTFIHPYTCCPVQVCFSLPCGCPKVKCSRNEVEFDYGRKEVEIRFYRNGDVKVKYREGCKLLNCLR